MDKSSSATCNVFYMYITWCEREAKSHVAKKISGRRRRRSRDEKDNQRVGDFRFINILPIFSIYNYYYYFYFIIFFLYFFYPLHLPTLTPTTHTHDPRPLPTIYDPRHLATLQQRAQKCERFELFIFFRTDLIQSEASCKLSSTSDWLISA